MNATLPEAGPSHSVTGSRDPAPRHFAYIDAIRGIAFLAILTLHVALAVGQFPGRRLLCEGHYGVRLFFLASAITLCFSMSKRQTTERFPVLFFFIRRFFRIAPLFWTAIFVYWIFPGVLPAIWVKPFEPPEIHHSYYILTALFLHGWHPYTFNSIVPGGWSIAVEMTFYAIFPICFCYIDTIRKAAVAMLVCLPLDYFVVPVISSKINAVLYPNIPFATVDFFQTRWFPRQLPVFIIGIFTYYLLRDKSVKEFTKSRFWSGCLLCFSVMVLLSLLLGNSHFISIELLNVLALAGLITALSGNRHGYIGKISFSGYVVQFAALGITLRLLHVRISESHAVFDAGTPFLNFLMFLELFSLILGMTVTISTLTFYLIEKPGIEIGRRLIRGIEAFRARSLEPAITLETQKVVKWTGGY
jgi:peptidoglycan/LPS O-acetylase OafA/YrhL